MLAAYVRRPWAAAVGALAAVALGSPLAHADGDSSAVAQALFASGRQLMESGKYAEACPKFAESNRIDPKLGTLLNLALCHERVGKSASAWAEYTQAAELAGRSGQSQREHVARERVTALEPTLARVVIDASAVPGMSVTLDEQPIGAAAYGTAIPVDPGAHVVRAQAPGKRAFSEEFGVESGTAPRSVHVALEDEVTAAATAPAVTPVSGGPPAHDAGEGTSSLKTWGWVIGGAGVALVGVGAYFGVHAFAMKSTAEGQCDAAGTCTQAGTDAIGDMKTSETVSTITTLAGVAAVGAGVYLLLVPTKSTASGSAPTTLRVGADLRSRGLRMELTW
jgi:hypothetical protein